MLTSDVLRAAVPRGGVRKGRRPLLDAPTPVGLPDPDACYRALLAHDPRFDGVFFTGVSTTGIYCRPVCRARTPARDRCTFHRSAAEAEKAGFRACLRCRPELAPGRSPVDAVSHLVARAVARIESGELNDGSVAHLAGTLGVTDRHLRRAMQSELGITPVELAQSRRLALAKQLLHDTSLDVATIAFASGFASIRRFNALFRARFKRPPTAIRRKLAPPPAARTAAAAVPSAAAAAPAADSVRLVLEYRPPLDWAGLLGFLGARAIPHVELVSGDGYARTVRVGAAAGWILVRPHAGRAALAVEVSAGLVGSLMAVVARLRALFDLDCAPAAVGAHLARDPRLAGLVAARPGLRVPGAFDPFEMTVRAVLGQQVSVRAATTFAGRLALAFGTEAAGAPWDPAAGGRAVLFPAAARLAEATVEQIAAIGLTRARAECLRELAAAVASGALDLSPGQPAGPLREALLALRGFGPWTAEYVAMRALQYPDAFPASDLGILKALGGCTPAQSARLAESWSPWRSYAVLHLWTGLATSGG